MCVVLDVECCSLQFNIFTKIRSIFPVLFVLCHEGHGHGDFGGQSLLHDYVFLNAGATPENPPTHLPAEKRLQVKAGSAAGMFKQILYCVHEPQCTPFAAYERPISAS